MEKHEKRILVADDDEAIRALLLTIFSRRGFAVDLARNGQEAIDRMSHCRYAVLLLDLMMPIKSGWDVLEYLAAYPLDLRPVTIVLTAGSEPRDLRADLVAGTVRKPFDVSLLLDGVVACIAALPDRPQLPGCPAPDSERPEKNTN
jgi:CheY-like chemotaxis protein